MKPMDQLCFQESEIYRYFKCKHIATVSQDPKLIQVNIQNKSNLTFSLGM